MKQINDFVYEVAPAEQITIHIVPYGTPFLVSAGLDGYGISASAEAFRFQVSRPKGQTHFFRLEFTFLPDAPESAKYAVELSGSDNSPYTFSILKTDLSHDVDLAFRVGDTGPK